ncbi:Hypothetical protein SMAX5B_000045 [Scophthalmus maximus]|uniref:Uncharacterized protein n=1 Tax=Scophthalmus maximus TaxID=52904 RepID=A0A2U9CUN4_SCOMX|nr:Hypothetical protein SMAX5B_000045 [Scophthalmus maximus]
MERDSLESARKALRAEALAHSARGAGEGADLGEELLRISNSPIKQASPVAQLSG